MFLHSFLTRRVLLPLLPRILPAKTNTPPSRITSRMKDTLLRLTLSSTRTELEEIRHKDHTQTLSKLPASASPSLTIQHLQSAYLKSLTHLVPSSLLHPPSLPLNTYLPTGPPPLLDFLRLQYLTCLTVPYLQTHDLYKDLQSLTKTSSPPPTLASYARLLSPRSKSGKVKVTSKNARTLLLDPLPPPPIKSYLLPLLNNCGSYVNGAPAVMYVMESLSYYELFPLEHLQLIANSISTVIGTSGKVLELGAGDGRLTKGLRYVMKGVDIVGTDDGTWGLEGKGGEVMKADYKEALKRYATEEDVVVVSWMPQGVDWTREIRRRGVKGYVLVGEIWDGCCGDNWETWGNPKYRRRGEGEEEEDDTPIYEREGYVMEVVGEGKEQISRYCSKGSQVTKTVLFTRVDR
ncbi:hypothetical protein TrCOL_g10309 [Triparma columacea]|uniref:S-adenosyl-L-methionine-dependent methyltransferase n=1 Tax=Triparma columacea TaxID=722753 RepID=A0A9W7FW93_9STRA|nr:hypothetical protein TrCOL_g10309 [Triparma columacea]